MTLRQIKEQPFRTFAEKSSVQWKVTVKEPIVNGERLLVVDFLQNTACLIWNGYIDTFRLICSKKGKWVQAVSEKDDAKNKILDEFHRVKSSYIFISEKEEKRLQRFVGAVGTMNHHLDNLCEWIEEVRKEMKRKEREKRGELQDEDYQLCPEALPDGLIDFIRTEILTQDNTLIYKKGNTKGLCYQCGHEVRAINRRFIQHYAVRCPYCGEEVWCVLEGGADYKAGYVDAVIAVQKGTDGETVFFRQWSIKRDPTARWERIEPFLKETVRYAVRGRKTAKWQKEAKEQFTMYHSERYDLPEWTRRLGNRNYDYGGVFFTGNIDAVLQGTKMQYAPLEEYLQGVERNENPRLFLTYFAKYPVMEFLWKAGYRRIARERINGLSKKNRNAIYWERERLKDCFKIPLRFLKVQPPGKWTMNAIANLNTLYQNAAEPLTEKEAAAFVESGIDAELIKSAMRYAKVSKILGYLEKQKEKKTGDARAYRDYIQECEQLHFDLTQKEILFPPSLNTAHERTMVQIDFEKNKADREKFKKTVKKLEKFSWEHDVYLIRPARAQEELTAEGRALHHCVGGYIKRMAEGKTAIFLLRKKEKADEPYFTLELQNKRVVQCRTDHNRSYESDPDVKAFVDMWIKEIVQKNKTKEVVA